MKISEASMVHSVFELWKKLLPKRRKQIYVLLVLMVFTALFEMVSIGTVLPFLGALTNPEFIYGHPKIQPLITFFKIVNPEDLLIFLGGLFAVVTAVAAGVRLLLLWVSSQITFSIGADFSNEIYRRSLYQPYATHLKKNSSELINAIIVETNGIIFGVISPAITMISSLIIAIAILVTLVYINPIVAIATFFIFAIIYISIARYTRNRLALDGLCIAEESTRAVKALQEGLGGIRDILLDGSQEVYCGIFRQADFKMRKAQASNAYITTSPRYYMESLGIIIIIVLAISLAQQPNGAAKAVPILGLLAVGAQKLLPVLHQSYAAWVSIQSSNATAQKILSLLDIPFSVKRIQTKSEEVVFKQKLLLKDVWFRYEPERPWVLKGVDIEILKGSRSGFIGETGGGKTTLLDIVMGLLSPTQGYLIVDNGVIANETRFGWQQRIAHVPQTIFLADSTIMENIAFGVERESIDFERVRWAAKQAQLSELIDSWADGFETKVGERGAKLSGGQRQRIGIARALYKNADVLILDEATSALDEATESAVMDSIKKLDASLTILIIAHRRNTLLICDQIFDLKDGKALQINSV